MKVYQKRDKYIVGILLVIMAVTSFYLYLQSRPSHQEKICQQISSPTVEVVVEFSGGIKGHGTGIIIARYERIHFVLTCWHVACHNNPAIKVVCHKNTAPFEAKVLHSDREKELAVIYFIGDTEYPIATTAEDVPALTSEVYLYGYGERWPALFTKGIFSGKISLWASHPNMWVANVHVWPGYSGCGVYNEDGELFGVASMMMISQRYFERLPWLCGFVPLPDIQTVLKDAGLARTRK